MKNLITAFITFCFFSSATAQNTVSNDSVYVGAGYAKQVYYSLANDSVGFATMLTPESWDLGFITNMMDAAIIVNHAKGISVYKVPNQDTSDWATLDTTGLYSWSKSYNSDTSWRKGAFNIDANSSDQFDFGWGKYDFGMHGVAGGDKLYILKTGTSSYKKIRFISKVGVTPTDTNTVFFRIANLDGSDDNLVKVNGMPYQDKNFIYYNISTNSVIDIEPAKTSWDILFTRYISLPVQVMAPPVTGVLSNIGVKVARTENINADYLGGNYADSLSSNISTIGYDWKTHVYSPPPGHFVINDSITFFIKAVDGSVYRLNFTGFGGSSNGKYVFAKEKLLLTSAFSPAVSAISAGIFPNPATGENFTLLVSSEQTNDALIFVYDLSGRNVISQKTKMNNGLNVIPVNINHLVSGSYLVKVLQNGSEVNLKMIVAK